MNCPKCQSTDIFYDGVDYICVECRARWGRNGESRAALLNAQGIKTEEKPMAVKGKCRNCERDNLTILGDHLCGGCYSSVKGIKKGSAEYDQVLAAAKERFTNKDAKTVIRKNRTTETDNSQPSTFGILKAQKDKIIEKQQSKNNGGPDIIDVLNARRDELNEELDEITKAISIIEKYRGYA